MIYGPYTFVSVENVVDDRILTSHVVTLFRSSSKRAALVGFGTCEILDKAVVVTLFVIVTHNPENALSSI